MRERDARRPESASLEDVLITDELSRRPPRPPDFAAESRALGALAEVLATDPRALPQTLADRAAALCRADSAGITLLEPARGPDVLRWPAVAGMWAPNAGGTLPRDASPCGVALERDTPLLFDRPERHFPDAARAAPEIVEALTVPFHVAGKPAGTVWVVAHTRDRRFDSEDARILTVLSRFAAAACRLMADSDTDADAAPRPGPAWHAGQKAAFLAAVQGRPLAESLGELVRTARDIEIASHLTDAAAIIISRHAESEARGHAEAALRASEEKYRTLFESIDEGFCIFDMLFDDAGTPVDYRFVEHNPAFERHTGLRDAAGRTVRELLPDQDRHWFEIYGRVATTGEPIRVSRYGKALRRWFEVYAFRIGPPEQRRVAALFSDVTARREAEEALKESEERLRAVAASLPNAAVFVVGPDLRYLLAAGEAVGQAGFAAAGLEGKTLAEALPEPLATQYAASYRRALAGEPFRAEHAAHGRHFVTHGVPLRSSAGAVTAALAVSYDITDRTRAEERLRLALAAARMGTWRWEVDADRHERDANLNRLLGLPARPSSGPLANFLACLHPADRGRVAEGFEASVRHGRNLSLEFRVLRPDGTVRWLRDQGDVFGGPEGRYLAGACVDVTDLMQAEAALRDARDRLEERVAERTADLAAEIARRRDLTRRLATAQEDERRRVSRDLHDSIGQLLAGLSMALKAVETAGGLSPPAAGKLAQAQDLLTALGKEVHGLAVRLRPTSLDDIGLEAALGQLVAEWSGRTGVRADFQAAGLGPGRLPPEIETAVYRMVQEALTNVARHARARVASVVVSRPDGFVTAVIEDDGVGFAPEATPRGRLGLVGMRERAALLGGEMEVESRPGSGTSVYVRIPIPEAEGGGP